jgi:hypothetical protein
VATFKIPNTFFIVTEKIPLFPQIFVEHYGARHCLGNGDIPIGKPSHGVKFEDK